MRDVRHLFAGTEIGVIVAKSRAALEQEIDAQAGDYILNVNLDEYAAYLEQRHQLALPKIRKDEIQCDIKESNVDVSQDRDRFIRDRSRPIYFKGTKAVFHIPFDGDGCFFQYKPTTWTTVIPVGEVVGNEVRVTYEAVEFDPVNLKAQFECDLSRIENYLSWLTRDAEGFNHSLQCHARQLTENRRQRLLRDQNLAAAIGFPMKSRPDAPRTYSVPVVRKSIPLRKPDASTKPFKPEPVLEMQEYEQILNIMSQMALVFERSPKAFSKMKEEDLRQHFLVQLNGQYEGQATGETFNFEGKTDILIRDGGRNIFIAECKFWKGASTLLKTVDQLLGYASWRDTKTAIALFNRQRGLSAALEKISDTIRGHSNFRKELSYPNETGFRFALNQRDDPSREILLTVLVFEVPK